MLQEGKARILTQLNDVFYNKAQVVNRDISLAVMRQFQKVRAEEHASQDVRAPKNKRNKGNLCATPRDSPILPHLLTPEEIEQMYLSHEEHAARMEATRAEASARTDADAPSADAPSADAEAKDAPTSIRPKPPFAISASWRAWRPRVCARSAARAPKRGCAWRTTSTRTPSRR